MKDFDIIIIAIGLLLLIIGYILHSIQENRNSDEVSGIAICFVAGFLLAVGLLINSI